jgi:hypothetical protein
MSVIGSYDAAGRCTWGSTDRQGRTRASRRP